jgi:hypothetical protein
MGPLQNPGCHPEAVEGSPLKSSKSIMGIFRQAQNDKLDGFAKAPK